MSDPYAALWKEQEERREDNKRWIKNVQIPNEEKQKDVTFTVDKNELKFIPKPGQNQRSCEHLGDKDFDKKFHQKYLTHLDINNLKGLEVEMLYNWKVGESLIVDRTHIHCASPRIDGKKLGLTTFTKK